MAKVVDVFWQVVESSWDEDADVTGGATET